MPQAVVALGSNIGESQTILQQAIADINQLPNTKVLAISNLYETAPVGGPEQDSFLNAVILVSTDLNPSQLLTSLHDVEAKHGRTREIHWGPRTLDLDLLDYENFTSHEKSLAVPHPRAHERGFVLAPWADVAPDWKLQIPQRSTKVAVSELLTELQLESDVARMISETASEWWTA